MQFWEICQKRFARETKNFSSMDKRDWQLFFSTEIPVCWNISSEKVKCTFENPVENFAAECWIADSVCSLSEIDRTFYFQKESFSICSSGHVECRFANFA